jgi:hypothetical protein
MPSSGIWHHVDPVKLNDVSVERIASIFSRLLLPAHAGSSLADFSTLKMEAIRSSETSVHFRRSTRRHIPEDGILHSHHCENLKSYKINIKHICYNTGCSVHKANILLLCGHASASYQIAPNKILASLTFC